MQHIGWWERAFSTKAKKRVSLLFTTVYLVSNRGVRSYSVERASALQLSPEPLNVDGKVGEIQEEIHTYYSTF